MLEELKVEVQEVLNEMWAEKLIPFPLNAGMITEGIGEYTIHFYDSRIYFAHVALTPDIPFRDAVRTAILERVRKVSGPLTNSATGGLT